MTEIIKDIASWRAISKPCLHSNTSLGLVPTMGHLHQGHESLIRRSLSENDITVVSIFVNPRQFNRQQDYAAYPSTLDHDMDRLKKMGVDYAFVPCEAEMYPCQYAIRIQDFAESNRMEGLHRPGHFAGVLTIVMKLFGVFLPDRAYFGEKDYQQYVLIEQMARAFFLHTKVVPCPTVRDADGVAYSSRNGLLNKLDHQRLKYLSIGLSQPGSSEDVAQVLQGHGFEVEYVESHFGRRFAAVNISGVRLIDNIVLQ
jgi:pantoate--beta-alanine ligase